jgi:hypothetical protein
MQFTAEDLVEMLWVHRAKDGRDHEFSMSPAMGQRIRRLRAKDGVAVWEGGTELLLGFPVRLDADIPANEIRLECLAFPQDVTVYREDDTEH